MIVYVCRIRWISYVVNLLLVEHLKKLITSHKWYLVNWICCDILELLLDYFVWGMFFNDFHFKSTSVTDYEFNFWAISLLLCGFDYDSYNTDSNAIDERDSEQIGYWYGWMI